MRAVHLEISYSLDTDAFINALRRFISRRVNPHTIYSDNGTNLVGGYLELKRSLRDLDQSTIAHRLSRLTLFAEAEHIVNSRPLTPVILDHEGGVPLSPNHLLLLRAEDHSIRVFNHRDNYVRRRWRQVQTAELYCRRLGPCSHSKQNFENCANSRQMNENCICVVFILVCLLAVSCV